MHGIYISSRVSLVRIGCVRAYLHEGFAPNCICDGGFIKCGDVLYE